MLTAGAGRPDAGVRDRWTDLEERLAAASSTVLGPCAARVAAALRRQAGSPSTAPAELVVAALALAVLVALAAGR